MPSPISLAIDLVKGLSALDKASALTVAAYLGYEYSTDGSSPPVLGTDVPDGKNPIPLPTRPTLVTPLKPAVYAHKTSADTSKINLSDTQRWINEGISLRSTQNSQLMEAVPVASPLIQNQIHLKNTLDEISFAIQSQSAVYAMIYETTERNLTLLNSTLLTMAQNAKVSTDMQTTIASATDYGDADYFYAFRPTGEYWSKADEATYLFDDQMGITTNGSLLPSRLYMASEVSLIDSMEKRATKGEIRDAVEAYRKSKLSVEVRALMDATLVKRTAEDAEKVKAEKEFYKASTEQALDKTMLQSLSKVAGWADMAIQREKIIQTPTTIKDMDGAVIAENVTPLSISITKDASIARGETDTNSMGGALINEIEDLFFDMDISADKFFNYVKVSEMIAQMTPEEASGIDNFSSWLEGHFK